MPGKSAGHQEIIERLSHVLHTNQDLQSFSSMVSAVYEEGYRRASEQYQQALAKLNIKVG